MSPLRSRRSRVLAVSGVAVLGLALAAPQASGRPSDRSGPGADRTTRTLEVQAAQAARAADAGRIIVKLGSRSAGSYLDPAGDLVVNVLNFRDAATVRAAGATPRLVRHSDARLRSILGAFDGSKAVPDTSWGHDPVSNRVIVSVGAGVPAASVKALQAVAARYGEAVTLERTAGSYQPYVHGGDAIYTSQWRCSLGFNTTGSKMITAGHCTEGLPAWFTSPGGGSIGPSLDSHFPRDDYGLISNTGGVAQPGDVNLWNGQYQDITGAANATVGQSVCKSGSTTHLTCGTVVRTNVTVNYGGGDRVRGLTQSNACADRGDSGGSWFSGSTAVGITSGGNLVCNSNTQTFFQPVVEALNRYGVSVL
jgi:streptogrisin D